MYRKLILVWTTFLLVLLHLVNGEQPPGRYGPPSGFTGVRGKKSIPDSEFFEPLAEQDLPNDKNSDFGMEKRAPNGFLGMRGKKDDSDLEDSMAEKRTPSGFMGMRGKKLLRDPLEVLEKRVPNGFMGMRGKKPFDTIYDVKRAQLSGFYGVRGKKQPGKSSFFGMRGKKYPYQFRGKFVGVRGKKSLTNSGMQEEAFPENGFAPKVDLNQLLLLLTANDKEDSAWEENIVPNGYEQFI